MTAASASRCTSTQLTYKGSGSVRSVPIAEVIAEEVNIVVVYAYNDATEPPISRALWRAMLREFTRNGGKTLTRAKVRELRRKLIRSRRASS